MFKRSVLFLVLAVAGAIAAPLERDLGNGLAYFRIRELPADLSAQPPARLGPSVIDLRYVRAEPGAAAAFLAWMKFRASSRSPHFVLANGETSRALLTPLTEQPRSAGVVVVGIPARGFNPHVAVSSSPANERRAYDALENGAPLVALLTDNPNKVRNDEASLSKDRLAEASADAADDALGGKRVAPPIDATLQRAVHLHRALVALRRL
jgi:hypothetical protein